LEPAMMRQHLYCLSRNLIRRVPPEMKKYSRFVQPIALNCRALEITRLRLWRELRWLARRAADAAFQISDGAAAERYSEPVPPARGLESVVNRSGRFLRLRPGRLNPITGKFQLLMHRHDVRWFDVRVHQPLAMSVSQRIEHRR